MLQGQISVVLHISVFLFFLLDHVLSELAANSISGKNQNKSY